MDSFVLSASKYGLTSDEVWCILIIKSFNSTRDRYPSVKEIASLMNSSSRVAEAIIDRLVTLGCKVDGDWDFSKFGLEDKKEVAPVVQITRKKFDPAAEVVEPSPTNVSEFSKHPELAKKIVGPKSRKPVAIGVWRPTDLAKYLNLLKDKFFGIKSKGRIPVKELGQMKSLMGLIDNVTIVKMMDYVVGDWKTVSAKYNLQGIPTIGLFVGFRDSFQADMIGTSASSSTKVRKDRSQEEEKRKNFGW